jgi:hypothetical protein
MRSSAGRGSLVLALICGAVPIHAAQVIIVLRPGGTGWQVVEADKITFNQKEKLRTGSSPSLDLRPDAYKKLPQVDIVRAGTLRRHAGGYLVRRMESGWVPVAADGAQVKTATSFAALWSAATVAYQEQAKGKTPTPLRADEIYAIVPGPEQSESLANLIADPKNFSGLGEDSEGAASAERMSLLVAVANSVTGQGAAKLQQVLLSEMLDAARKINAGIAKADDLLLGLKYADVSAQAYPKDERQEKARAALIERKAWLDRRMAILKAFRAAELWDAYLDKYSDFERWDNGFQDLRKSREQAFQESGKQHRARGEQYYNNKNYPSALEELTLAQRRLPSDRQIAGLVEKVKLDDERQQAAGKPKVAEDKGSSNYRLITRRVQNADNYINDGKDAEKRGRDLEAEGKSLKTAGRLTEAETRLKEAEAKLEEAEAKLQEAEGEIQQAEGVDKESPRIMLSRARLLQARKQPLKALAILDEYARRVVDTEGKGDELRNNIAYELKSTKEIKKAAVAKALADGDYAAAQITVQEGLALDANDLDFLLNAGRIEAIMRNYAHAADMFKQYLNLSQTPGADQKRRAEVYNALSLVKPPDPEPEGKPNWFSAYRNPTGIAYCPISLMPNARVVDVKASRKLTTTFQWTGDQLMSVQNTSLEAGEGRSAVYFDYFKDRGGVRRVSVEPLEDAAADLPTPRFTAAGTVGTGKGTYLGLPNHPVVDPLMVEWLTGKRVATIVSGNPYFHPFVWNGIYVFIAEYDDRGRVKSARQIPAAGQASRTLDFKWDGDSLRLIEIAERGGVYKRTMTYSGNKLMVETVVFGGRSSKIEYKYRGDQLLEANCGDDVSLDSRSRHVTFR